MPSSRTSPVRRFAAGGCRGSLSSCLSSWRCLRRAGDRAVLVWCALACADETRSELIHGVPVESPAEILLRAARDLALFDFTILVVVRVTRSRSTEPHSGGHVRLAIVLASDLSGPPPVGPTPALSRRPRSCWCSSTSSPASGSSHSSRSSTRSDAFSAVLIFACPGTNGSPRVRRRVARSACPAGRSIGGAIAASPARPTRAGASSLPILFVNPLTTLHELDRVVGRLARPRTARLVAPTPCRVDLLRCGTHAGSRIGGCASPAPTIGHKTA